MFTGIVEELGRVASVRHGDEHAELAIACTTVVSDAAPGDSVSVDGCCLTVTRLTDDGFTADLMAQTLLDTALAERAVGDGVNLERAMHPQRRFGGHLVQGHVDGVGEVTARHEQPGTVFFTFRVPAGLTRYLVAKGSVTVAGVSLTVIDAVGDEFRVGVIPHTLSETTFGRLAVGDRVNLEVDVVAKYVERLLVGGVHTPYAPGAPDLDAVDAVVPDVGAPDPDPVTPDHEEQA